MIETAFRRNVSAIALIAILSAICLVAAIARSPNVDVRPGPPIAKRYAGVNLASGEFGSKKATPIYGRDYFYPAKRTAQPFLDAGMNAVRIPFHWHRLQPAPFAPLDPVELRRLDKSLDDLRSFELVILDAHDFGTYRGTKLDQPTQSGSMLADLWTKLSQRYGSRSNVAFGIMNEPHSIAPSIWRNVAEQALQAIRKTGAKNLVLVPGSDWSGAHSWTSGSDSNASAFASLRDPADNIAFEMHQYLDANSSGTHETCIAPDRAAARLAAATAWLRANRARGFLGEFGAPPGPDCLAALDAMLGAIDAAPDVWLGWTYWAGGAMWGNYSMSVQPGRDGNPKPQMAILERHLNRGRPR